MTRRGPLHGVFSLIAAAVFVAALPLASDAAESGLRIRHVSVDSFPKVEVVVSSSSELDPKDLSVDEGGEARPAADVEPLNESGLSIDVVLVIDTSGSMQGAAMASALTAARSFIDEVPSDVRIGVVSFSDSSRRVSGLTIKRSETRRAIDSLKASGETALFDGVRTAAKMFHGDSQHNIVLLSDGGDTASGASLRSAGDAAQHADAAIFAVGLKTSETDVDALETLSESTGGRYRPAATADLSTIYKSLATELASQFAITFRSEAGSGEDIAIHVSAPSGEDEVTVLAPRGIVAPKHSDSAPPAAAPAAIPMWVLPLLLILCFAAVFIGGLTLVGTRARRARETRLRRALADRVEVGEEAPGEPESARPGWLPDAFVTAGRSVTERGGVRLWIEKRLEQGSVALKAEEFVGLALVAALVGYLAGGLLVHNLILGIVLAVAGAAAPFVWLSVVVSRRLAKINDQIPDILTVLAGSLRAGHSFLQALDMAAREVDEPGAGEFQRVVTEIRLGREITEALEALAARVGSEGFSWAILAVNMQREVGGNLAELLDTVAETLRTRETLQRQVRTASAEGRLSMYILAALPPVISIYMAVVRPDYIGLLFDTHIGRVMLMVGASLLVAGFLWMKRVVSLDV